MTNLNAGKYFARLCEGVLFETSTSLNLVRQNPGARELIHYLHKEKQLSHNQEYEEVPKVDWKEIKFSYHMHTWIILTYPKGTAAIRRSDFKDGYEAVFSPENKVDPDTGETIETETIKSPRASDIMKSLKNRLGGNPVKIYVGHVDRNSKEAPHNKRKAREKEQPAAIGHDEILKKFKPLWVKSIVAAAADVKGMVLLMIKNDAYQKAQDKIRRLHQLEDLLDKIDSGDDRRVKEDLMKNISNAIVLTASHYYPDDTGEITTSYGKYIPQSNVGENKLIADINRGDTKKIGTILAFFKRSLIV